VKFVVVPVTPFQQNCSVLWDERTNLAAIVDPGGDLDRVLAQVERMGLTLEKILVTHGHLDHAAATSELSAFKHLPIEGPHADDQFLIEHLPEQAQRFGFPESQSFVPDRWLSQGDEVTVGGERLEVRHCPGHTPGHVAFFSSSARVAIVGDVLFAGSIGRTDLPRGNQVDLIRSIRSNLFPLGDEVAFVPGHGPGSTFGRERRTNPFVADRLFD
jgi:glyoxylase-like metal-dependent hydrolase (beta-lactamase superfamily II)